MRRHPFDWHGLVWGSLALAAAAYWALREAALIDSTLILVVPLGLILAGLVGVVISLMPRPTHPAHRPQSKDADAPHQGPPRQDTAPADTAPADTARQDPAHDDAFEGVALDETRELP